MTQTSQSGDKSKLGVAKAILIGHLISTVPIFALIFGFRWIGLTYFRGQWWIFLIIGFLLAWFWWAFIVPRWRKWALSKGAPEQELHQWAVITGLEWAKGSVFRRTEMKDKDRKL